MISTRVVVAGVAAFHMAKDPLITHATWWDIMLHSMWLDPRLFFSFYLVFFFRLVAVIHSPKPLCILRLSQSRTSHLPSRARTNYAIRVEVINFHVRQGKSFAYSTLKPFLLPIDRRLTLLTVLRSAVIASPPSTWLPNLPSSRSALSRSSPSSRTRRSRPRQPALERVAADGTRMSAWASVPLRPPLRAPTSVRSTATEKPGWESGDGTRGGQIVRRFEGGGAILEEA